MGKSLARNLARRGFRLALFNRFVAGEEEQVAEKFIAAFTVFKTAKGFEDIQAFVNALERPRKIMLMVKAGSAIDELIAQLLPFLEPGDLIIDGGNAHYLDTERRTKDLSSHKIHFVGTGVSGGEEGALKGPAIMPGGSREGYQQCARFLEAIAAKDNKGQACCGYIGGGGAGHFVKMVHNGIEYAEMQLLAELYLILRNGARMDPGQIADFIEEWLRTDNGNYLLEITVDILRRKEGEQWLIDLILDKAGNKGTGSWTTIAAAELGVPIPSITAALFARYISAFKAEREKAARHFHYRPVKPFDHTTLQELPAAYHVARIVNHHQGFHLLSAASEAYGWSLNLSEVARIWTNGCIIRSRLMTTLVNITKRKDRLLQDTILATIAEDGLGDLAKVVSEASVRRLPIPCFAASYNYLLNYSQAQSSANMIQAQRDYFGAHTYQRTDDETGRFYHTEWC